jgi:lactoylglutathione lyase
LTRAEAGRLSIVDEPASDRNEKDDKMKLAHVALWTRDLDAAAAFWQNYFDAEVGEEYHSKRRVGFVSRFVRLPGSDGEIEIMSGPWIEESQYSEMVGWDHIAVSLGDAAAVDALASRCKDDGILISGPRTTGDGYYEAVIAMPDGTRVEITSFTRATTQLSAWDTIPSQMKARDDCYSSDQK